MEFLFYLFKVYLTNSFKSGSPFSFKSIEKKGSISRKLYYLKNLLIDYPSSIQ